MIQTSTLSISLVYTNIPKLDEYIIPIAVGILCYFILNPIWNYATRLLRHYLEMYKNKSIQKEISSILPSENEGYTPLTSTLKLYKKNFTTLITSDLYIRQIPSKHQNKLRKLHFGDEQATGSSFSKQKKNLEFLIQTYFKEYIADTETFLNAMADETACCFIQDLKAAKLRFNKSLFGIQAISNNDTIELYNSDYFTFKFTVRTYNALKKITIENKLKTPLTEYKKPQEIEALVPFLNSIGVGGFIIINRGKGDELLFGWRDNRSCESGGYWHFTYDETYTQDDINKDSNGEKGLMTCLRRALDEEIGINSNQLSICTHPAHMGVIDAGIIHTEGNDNRFEFEVCSFVRVCLSNKFTIDDFIKCYQFAKDAAIETSNMHIVPISEIEQFCENNTLSPEARHLALQLKLQIEHGVIKSDYDCYNDILKSKTQLFFQ